MSSTPKAKRSQIVDLVVVPDSWESHPTIEYSHINSCKFEGLSSDNRIERSRFTNVALSSDGTDKSKVERSVVKDSDIRHSIIERSEIQGSKIDAARVERSRFTLATVIGPKVKIERSIFEECEVRRESKIERSNLTQVLLENSKVEFSNLKSSFVTNSKLERANVTDCDIGDCKIQRTNFTGMYLRNGIWERGDLVGRVDKTKEVIIKPKSEMPALEPDRSETAKVGFHLNYCMNKANNEFRLQWWSLSLHSDQVWRTPRTSSFLLILKTESLMRKSANGLMLVWQHRPLQRSLPLLAFLTRRSQEHTFVMTMMGRRSIACHHMTRLMHNEGLEQSLCTDICKHIIWFRAEMYH